MNPAASSLRPMVPALSPRARAPFAPASPMAPAAPSGPTGGVDFDRALRQAQLMAASDRDAAVPLFWRALRAASGVAQDLQVAEAVADGGWAFKDVRSAAMSRAVVQIATRGEAMAVATALAPQGKPAEDWALGALRKALALSATAEQALEIAAFAGRQGRAYRDVRGEAMAAAARLT